LFTIDQSPQKYGGESDSNQACHPSLVKRRDKILRTYLRNTERQHMFKSFVRYLGDFQKKLNILQGFKGFAVFQGRPKQKADQRRLGDVLVSASRFRTENIQRKTQQYSQICMNMLKQRSIESNRGSNSPTITKTYQDPLG